MKKDNTTESLKISLRKKALGHIDNPVVMETHGGQGKIFLSCYSDLERGAVFEKDREKATLLGLQRPTWRVYQADCVPAIAYGVANDLPINLLDVDPYGDPWPTISAFFSSVRTRSNSICLVVTDGNRLNLKYGRGWRTKTFKDLAIKYGNDSLHANYLNICEEMLQEIVAKAGYRLDQFSGYYCGKRKDVAHFLGVLKNG